MDRRKELEILRIAAAEASTMKRARVAVVARFVDLLTDQQRRREPDPELDAQLRTTAQTLLARLGKSMTADEKATLRAQEAAYDPRQDVSDQLETLAEWERRGVVTTEDAASMRASLEKELGMIPDHWSMKGPLI